MGNKVAHNKIILFCHVLSCSQAVSICRYLYFLTAFSKVIIISGKTFIVVHSNCSSYFRCNGLLAQSREFVQLLTV